MTFIQLTFLVLLITGEAAVQALFIRMRMEKLKEQLDGRLTQLLSVSQKLAHAQGLAEGKANHNSPKKKGK